MTSAGQDQACPRGSSFSISRFKVCLPFKDPPAKDLQLRNRSLSVLGRGQGKIPGGGNKPGVSEGWQENQGGSNEMHRGERGGQEAGDR